MNICDVLSFDADKIKFVCLDGAIFSVEKTTNYSEFRRIISAIQYTTKNPIYILGKYYLSPVPVIGWDNINSILTTKYCSGINLEHLLKRARGEKRAWCAELIVNLFWNLKKTGFLWGDCAPRHIILNHKARSMRIVDFERNMSLLGHESNPELFSRYIKNYALEEFSCFLFKNEQEKIFHRFFVRDVNFQIPIEAITSQRKKMLLSEMFGDRDEYMVDQVENVEFLMASVATPFLIDRSPFYPMEIIDKVTRIGGTESYAEIVRKIQGLNEEKRHIVLRRIAERYL